MKLFTLFSIFILSLNLIAQDPVFSLGDQNQLYNNPAFSGTANNFRFGNSYRNQWPSLSGSYITNNVYADQYLGKFGGAGISYTLDKAGQAFTSNSVSFSYSYGIKIGDTSRLQFGISPGIIQESIDINKLTFGDMINPRTGFVYTSTPIANESITKFNFSAGLLFYNHQFYAGYALHHINRANMSFYDTEQKLDIRHSVQLGLYGHFGKDGLINVFANAHFQGSSYNISSILQIQTHHILTGIGYRTGDAILARLGVVFKNFKIIYGYDATVSKLSSIGSHEIALQILLNINKNTNPLSIAY